MSGIHETYPTDIILSGEASEDKKIVNKILNICITLYYNKRQKEKNNDVNDKNINIVFFELSNYIQKTLKVMGEGNGGRYLKRNESQQRWDELCFDEDNTIITQELSKKVIKRLNLFGPAKSGIYLKWDETKQKGYHIHFVTKDTAADQNEASFDSFVSSSAGFIRNSIMETTLSKDDKATDERNNAMSNNETTSLADNSPQEVQAQSAEHIKICLMMLSILEKNDAIKYFNEGDISKYNLTSEIEEPKDFSTIRTLIKYGHYDSIDAFNDEVNLALDDEMKQNENKKDSKLYKAAKELKAQFKEISGLVQLLM